MVQRFSEGDEGVYPDDNGPLVEYEDYAALEAELDTLQAKARTLTVKLPAKRNVEMMSDLSHNGAIQEFRASLESGCAAAGIKLQIEGE